MNEREDFYVLVDAGGEYEECHIWATPEQADALRAALVTRIKDELGYEDATVEVDAGGEYEYILNPTQDIAELANEIIANGGWVEEDE